MPSQERRVNAPAPTTSAPPAGATKDGATKDGATKDAVERALAVPTRAGIYRRLRTEGQSLSAREVADLFGLHSNVARNHLDVLADAGLVVTGRRKNPSGGRPAKVYVAREQAAGDRAPLVPPGSQLATSVVVQLIAGLPEYEPKLELLAEEQGRRLVAAAAGRADAREFGAAAVVAVEALRQAFPEVRIVDANESDDDEIVVSGLEVALRIIGEVDGRVGDALARGFLRGALAAAGAPAIVTSKAGTVQARLDEAGIGAQPTPRETLDVRGQTYQSGVVAAMQSTGGLRPGDYLEILTDSEGAPAAFARWADRAGHQIVDVARVRDIKGKKAVRLLIRKAAG